VRWNIKWLQSSWNTVDFVKFTPFVGSKDIYCHQWLHWLESCNKTRNENAVWCGVTWCDVVWRGVMWCDVVWCGWVIRYHRSAISILTFLHDIFELIKIMMMMIWYDMIIAFITHHEINVVDTEADIVFLAIRQPCRPTSHMHMSCVHCFVWNQL